MNDVRDREDSLSNDMQPIHDLLVMNYQMLNLWYLHGHKRDAMTVSFSDGWLDFASSKGAPALKRGKLYCPEEKDGITLTLWHAWRIARSGSKPRVIISSSGISAKTISMHLQVLVSRCNPRALSEGSFDPENWRKLAAAAGQLDEADIHIGEVDELAWDALLEQVNSGLVVFINSEMDKLMMAEMALRHDIPVVSLSGITEVTWSNPLGDVSFSLLGKLLPQRNLNGADDEQGE